MMKIHFLNVGHGDCCIIEFLDTGRVAIIDINMTESMDEESFKELMVELAQTDADQPKAVIKSMVEAELAIQLGNDTNQLLQKKGYTIELQNPITYLNEEGITGVFRFISTHPHMDHLSGLKKLAERGITNFWVLKNDFDVDTDELTNPQKEDWDLYKICRDCSEEYYNFIKIMRIIEGSIGDYYTPDGIKILAPNNDLIELANDEEQQNIMSYVLLIEHAGQKIILSGDATEETWEYLVTNYENEIKNVNILKASHHGRDSGYYQPAVELMNPEYTIVSVGKKPSTDASNKYRNYCDNVFSTRWKGNIVFEIDNEGNVHLKHNTIGN